jgi:hypothetical protein
LPDTHQPPRWLISRASHSARVVCRQGPPRRCFLQWFRARCCSRCCSPVLCRDNNHRSPN